MSICIDDLRSGDCILCHGHNLFDCLIEKCTSSRFSHALVIVRDPFYIDKQLSGVYILESAIESSPDVEDGKIHLGVQLQPIQVLFNDYKYEDLVVRQLQIAIPNVDDKILRAYDEVKNKPYNLDPIDWIGAKLLIDDGFKVENLPWYKKCFGSGEKQTQSFWCSAMVAYFYVQLGLLHNDVSFAILAPEHFSQKHDADMPWLIPCLGEEKSLKS